MLNFMDGSVCGTNTVLNFIKSNCKIINKLIKMPFRYSYSVFTVTLVVYLILS